MSTTVNTVPALVPSVIYKGSPWPGVAVRYVDPDGTAEDITVTASVATATVADSGVWLADCDIADADADGYVAVTLDAAATAALPVRTVLIDVYVVREGETDPNLVMRLSTKVESALPVEA